MSKLALALLAATLATPACNDHLCTLEACSSQALIRADVPASWDRLRSATITTCHNGTCFTGSFSALSQMPTEGIGFGFSLGSVPGEFGVEPVNVSASGRRGTFSIDVTWPVGTDAKSGDTYRVTVTDAGGTSLVSLNEAVASYEISQPNGPECGPTCRVVTFDRRAP